MGIRVRIESDATMFAKFSASVAHKCNRFCVNSHFIDVESAQLKFEMHLSGSKCTSWVQTNEKYKESYSDIRNPIK